MERYGVPADAITIARPGVDASGIPAAPVSPPLILSVGILHPRKGHDILIKALSGLSDLDWRAVIVGNPWDADHAAALSRQVERSDVARRIELAGRVTQERLEQLYARLDLRSGHAIRGPWPCLRRALVRGLPIVSCRTGAVPETVPTGPGILVPPEELAMVRQDAIDRLDRGWAPRLRETGRRDCRMALTLPATGTSSGCKLDFASAICLGRRFPMRAGS